MGTTHRVQRRNVIATTEGGEEVAAVVVTQGHTIEAAAGHAAAVARIAVRGHAVDLRAWQTDAVVRGIEIRVPTAKKNVIANTNANAVERVCPTFERNT